MKGACSNQIVKCIVYSNNHQRGIEQLLKIEEEYKNKGIKAIRKIISSIHSEIVFDNEEEWLVVSPNLGARGYRWRKAYVDSDNVTIKQLENIIKPYGCLYQWEEYKTFGW